MNKTNIALLLIYFINFYALYKRRKRIEELENELIDLKMRAMFYKPEENTDQSLNPLQEEE